MRILTGPQEQLETFIQTLEQLAWGIFPTIGRTVVEEEGVKYLVNRHNGSDHNTKTRLRYTEVVHDIEQDIYYLPYPSTNGYEQVYIDLILTKIVESGLTVEDTFQRTPTED